MNIVLIVQKEVIIFSHRVNSVWPLPGYEIVFLKWNMILKNITDNLSEFPGMIILRMGIILSQFALKIGIAFLEIFLMGI